MGRILHAKTTLKVAAISLLAVTLFAVANSFAQSEITPTAVDSLLAESDLVQPTPQAIEVEPVNLWDTGIDATTAVLMTPFFPGWGQLYAENSWHAALGFGTQMYFWTNMLVRDRRAVRANDFGESLPEGDINRQRYREIADENWEQMRDFAWWSAGVLLLVALDAYVGAHLYDFDADPVPVPDRWEDTFGQVGDGLPGAESGPSLVVFQWQKTF